MERLEPVAVAFRLHRTLFSLTLNVLQFENRSEEFPGTRSQMIHGWQSCCAIVGGSPVEGFSTAMMMDFIELAYWQTKDDEDAMVRFARPVATLMDDGNAQMVASGLQGMREKESPGTQFDPWRVRKQESSQEWWGSRHIFDRGETDVFEEWLDEFQATVLDYAESVDIEE